MPISLLEKSSPPRQNFAVPSIPAIIWRRLTPQTIEFRSPRFGVPAAFDECVTTASASALPSSVGAPPASPASSSAANHGAGKGFPSLIQMLLSANDSQIPDSRLTATALEANSNPAVATVVPQPTPPILPFQFSLLPGLHQSGASVPDKKESDPPANDDTLGTFVFPASLPMAFIPGTPLIETSDALAVARSTSALPESDSDVSETSPSRKGIVPQDHPEELFTLAPILSDDALSQPRIQVQTSPVSQAPSPVAFEAKLTSVTPPSGSFVIPAAGTPLRQTLAPAPTPSTKRDDSQGNPERNGAGGSKPQLKALSEKANFAEPVEPSTEAKQISNAAPLMDSGARPAKELGDTQTGAANQKTAQAPPTSHETEPAPVKTTVRDLSLRLTSAAHEQVDVKVQDKGGELHVAVHSVNSELNADLRQQVGDLVSKLDRSGFQTEITKPSANDTATSAPGKQGDAQNQEFTGQQQQQQSREEAQQRPRKGRQPQWLHERNTTFETTGVEGLPNR
jgi:hypothetical protein